MKIEYLGETADGRVCSKCGNKPLNATITKKKIFGRLFEMGKPQEVSLEEFPKFMATGLFIKK